MIPLDTTPHLPSTKCISGAQSSDTTHCGQEWLGNTWPLSLQVTRSRDQIRGKASGALPEETTPR